MEYNFSEKELRERLRLNYKIYDKMKNKTHLLDDILNEIDANNTLIGNFVTESYKDEVYIDKRMYLPEAIYYDYISIPTYFKRLVKDVYINMETYYDEDLGEHKKYNLTNEELLELSHDFFKSLPTKNKMYLAKFNEFSNPKNHQLRFDDSKDNEFFDMKGVTFPLYNPTYKPYIIISKNHNLLDFQTLNHEFAHGIFLGPQKNDHYNNRISQLRELEGSWFNFLSAEYVKKNIDKIEGLKLESGEFYTMINDLIGVYFIGTLCDTYKKNKKITLKLLRDNLYNKEHYRFNLEREAIDRLYDEYPRDRLTYFYSYLVNLDLQKVYREDPEKAFYYFENIEAMYDKFSIRTLKKNGITYMDDEYENFDNEIKKLNKIKEV